MHGDLGLVDLGNEFFLAKFSKQDDKGFVLFRGSWIVANHYLTVCPWHPNFDPYEATIDKVVVWSQTPLLWLILLHSRVPN